MSTSRRTATKVRTIRAGIDAAVFFRTGNYIWHPRTSALRPPGTGAGANTDHLTGIARTDESDRLSQSIVVRLIVNVLVLLIVLEMAQNLSGFLTCCPNFAVN
jgi:hypothetical protein